MSVSLKHLHRQARKRRIRAKVQGTLERPRLSVYRSLTAISVQLIDDQAGKTLVSAELREVKGKPTLEGAKKLGMLLAKKTLAANIATVVFDRNAYRYHGRIKALADAAREGGLVF
ncbi:50S ribosomal protein L18 [Candidatus Peregrinibacteria bacterium]|nr:50S ribosomal protein L18 [Candidatus Peregrinibacteria bacterium]